MTGRRRNRSAQQITRDRKLIAFFATVLLGSGTALAAHLTRAEAPPVQAVERTVPMGEDDRLSIQFVGDTMLGDDAQALLDRFGYDWPLAAMAPQLDGDHVIANAEGPFTLVRQPYNRAKSSFYPASPAAAGALARAGVDTIALGNNHTMDAGPQGLADTFTNAEAAGLSAFGAGHDLAGAQRPLILHSAFGDVGVVALGENFGRTSRAADAAPGTVVLSPETVQRGIDLARAAGADWVIAYVHWGDNYVQITDQQRYWAQMLVKAGYDMVIGTGPHVTQPIEVIDSVPVAYSIGNFAFGAAGGFSSHGVPGYGLMISAVFTRHAQVTVSVRCLLTDDAVVNFQPIPCTPEQAAVLLPAYNPDMAVLGNVGLLPCACSPRGSRE